MDRQVYVTPELYVKRFSDDEIITASTNTPTRDPDKPIELPFVPANLI